MILIRNQFHELLGRPLLIPSHGNKMKSGLISHKLFLPVAHGIMHRLPGNMKMLRNLCQRQILIIV